jgi:hypothetical protein
MAKECKEVITKIPKRRSLSLKGRRKGFAPVELGFLRKEAAREASAVWA